MKIIDPLVARPQSDDDKTRRRGRIDLHIRRQPALINMQEGLAAEAAKGRDFQRWMPEVDSGHQPHHMQFEPALDAG